GLAEVHGIGLDDASACRTARRQGLQGDGNGRLPEAPTAADAAQELGVAMDFRHALVAGGAVQIVDVLGDEIAQDADPLELSQGAVASIGLSLRQGLDDLAWGREPLLPIASGVG